MACATSENLGVWTASMGLLLTPRSFNMRSKDNLRFGWTAIMLPASSGPALIYTSPVIRPTPGSCPYPFLLVLGERKGLDAAGFFFASGSAVKLAPLQASVLLEVPWHQDGPSHRSRRHLVVVAKWTITRMSTPKSVPLNFS